LLFERLAVKQEVKTDVHTPTLAVTGREAESFFKPDKNLKKFLTKSEKFLLLWEKTNFVAHSSNFEYFIDPS